MYNHRYVGKHSDSNRDNWNFSLIYRHWNLMPNGHFVDPGMMASWYPQEYRELPTAPVVKRPRNCMPTTYQLPSGQQVQFFDSAMNIPAFPTVEEENSLPNETDLNGHVDEAPRAMNDSTKSAPDQYIRAYQIHVNPIRGDISHCSALRYFRQFGTIVSYSFEMNNQHENYSTALICYKHEAEAERAIQAANSMAQHVFWAERRIVLVNIDSELICDVQIVKCLRESELEKQQQRAKVAHQQIKPIVEIPAVGNDDIVIFESDIPRKGSELRTIFDPVNRTRLILRSVCSSTEESTLFQLFSTFGYVKDCAIMADRTNHLSMALIEFLGKEITADAKRRYQEICDQNMVYGSALFWTLESAERLVVVNDLLA